MHIHNSGAGKSSNIDGSAGVKDFPHLGQSARVPGAVGEELTAARQWGQTALKGHPHPVGSRDYMERDKRLGGTP
jgi:hypothetical protein